MPQSGGRSHLPSSSHRGEGRHGQRSHWAQMQAGEMKRRIVAEAALLMASSATAAPSTFRGDFAIARFPSSLEALSRVAHSIRDDACSTK